MANRWRQMHLGESEVEAATEGARDEVIIELCPDDNPQCDLQWTLVGRFLSNRPVNFIAMKSTLADLWRPLMGVRISRVVSDRFLFQFFHDFDFDRITTSGPWTFDGKLLLWKPLQPGEVLTSIPLNSAPFWVQVYNLPFGFLTESVGRQLGNSIGRYLDCDLRDVTGEWKNYFRIRTEINISLPLKRQLSLKLPSGVVVQLPVKYERLPQFCFFCGIIGHTEHGCLAYFQRQDKNVAKPFSTDLRAPGRRQSTALVGSPWLRDNSGDSNHESAGVSPMSRDSNTKMTGENHAYVSHNSNLPSVAAQSQGFVSLVKEVANGAMGNNQRALMVTSSNIGNQSNTSLTESKRRRHELESYKWSSPTSELLASSPSMHGGTTASVSSNLFPIAGPESQARWKP